MEQHNTSAVLSPLRWSTGVMKTTDRRRWHGNAEQAAGTMQPPNSQNRSGEARRSARVAGGASVISGTTLLLRGVTERSVFARAFGTSVYCEFAVEAMLKPCRPK
ncbi:hypothetical protein MRX96_019774 [Rhipicephalus microplus]